MPDPTNAAMNLRSCDNCGAVLDADKLIFPDQKNWWREDGTYDVGFVARSCGWLQG
jgi:hypothetical protein